MRLSKPIKNLIRNINEFCLMLEIKILLRTIKKAFLFNCRAYNKKKERSDTFFMNMLNQENDTDQRRPKPIFRQMKDSDYQQVKQLINETWHFERFFSNHATFRAYLNWYTHQMFAQANYGEVIEDSGKIIGILIGKKDCKNLSFSNVFHTVLSWIHLIIMFIVPKQYLQESYEQIDDQKIYRRMLLKQRQNYDGCIELFIVSSAYQGKGFGKKLVNNFLVDCEQEGLKRIYVFTDTMCNFNFYAHQHFNKVDQFDDDFIAKKERVAYKIFLYEYTVISN